MAGFSGFSALQFRDFRLFWFGQLISLSGTWMQSVAQGWLVYSLTKSPFYLGLVAAAGSFPILLFTLAGGIAADRFRKRNLLLLTQALSILPALLLGILINTDRIAVWMVIVLAFLLGTFNAFDIPARQSFIGELVGRSALTNAIALNSAAFHSARMIGPVIAGVTIAYLGLAACFYLNALSFLAVLIALSMIQVKGKIHKDSRGILKNLVEGIQFIKSRDDIVRVILLIAVFSLIGMPFITLLPVYAGEIFKAGPKGYGLLVGATGLGALSAALLLAFKRDRENKSKFMALSTVSVSFGLFIFSISRNFSLSLLMLVVTGWGLVSFLATANSFIQLAVPDNMRGRAMSIYTFVFLGAAPIGNSIMGVVADVIGTPRAVTLSAVLCIAASMVFTMKIFRGSDIVSSYEVPRT
ncbi:MAG: MFS transporter [Thermodesulfovibrionales bacterium]|nr:MFS transporter [Thermodesulfovibrionales bacterium]